MRQGGSASSDEVKCALNLACACGRIVGAEQIASTHDADEDEDENENDDDDEDENEADEDENEDDDDADDDGPHLESERGAAPPIPYGGGRRNPGTHTVWGGT